MIQYPTKLQLVGQAQLQINWSDGQIRMYRIQELRDGCPCAMCREKDRGEQMAPPDPLRLNVLSPGEAQPLRIASMKPVGNYAYNIVFSDGHDSGIFTFELLLALGERMQADS